VLHRSAFVAERETAETAANSFANELLAPIDAVRPELPKMITLLALSDTKARWACRSARLSSTCTRLA
jgi:Zn-dependent peptidase ImmA (M78 family)